MKFDGQAVPVPEIARVATEEGIFRMGSQGGSFGYGDVSVNCAAEGEALKISLTARKTPVRSVMLRWNIPAVPGARYMGDAFERSYGDLEWRGLRPDRVMSWYFLASDGKKHEGWGVKTAPDALCFWLRDEAGITLWLDTRSGGGGVELAGRTVVPAVVVHAGGEDCSAFRFAQRFCKALCDDPLLPGTPVLGSNNWNYAYGRTSEDEFLREAVQTLELAKDSGVRPYIVADDGWQECADLKGAAGRPYLRGNLRFENMEKIARRITEMGGEPGLWFRPLESLDRTHDACCLRDGEGTVMDCSLPETLERIGRDVDRFVSWGYRLFKYDFVVYDLLGLFVGRGSDALLRSRIPALKNRGGTNAMYMKNLFRTIREHAGGAVLIGCNVAGHLAAGNIHLFRSGDDTSGRTWDRTAIMGVNTLAFRLCQHRAFYEIDADCVGFMDPGVPWELNRQHLDLVASSGTPLFVAAKPGVLTGEQKQAISAAYALDARYTDSLEPLDWMENAMPSRFRFGETEKRYSWLPDYGLRGFSADD